MMCIPRKMLIHRAEVRTVIKEDCFGVKEFSDGVKLKYVRVDYESGDEKSEHGYKGTGSAVLIYDAVNSVPKNFSFENGQIVSYSGAIFRVKNVKMFYDSGRLHHVEVEMAEYGEAEE